jgi:hypothetical protein
MRGGQKFPSSPLETPPPPPIPSSPAGRGEGRGVWVVLFPSLSLREDSDWKPQASDRIRSLGLPVRTSLPLTRANRPSLSSGWIQVTAARRRAPSSALPLASTSKKKFEKKASSPCWTDAHHGPIHFFGLLPYFAYSVLSKIPVYGTSPSVNGPSNICSTDAFRPPAVVRRAK